MPLDPTNIKIAEGQGSNPLSPSPTNLLMAAATMHQMGRLSSGDKSPDPMPKSKGKRALKVVR